MASLVGTIPKPVRKAEGGVLRVGDSRVSLDTVVYHFNNGMDAAEIQDAYDSMSLAQVHAALAYYLHNRAKVDQYIAKRAIQAEKIRKEIKANYSTPGLREKLLARRGKPSDEWE